MTKLSFPANNGHHYYHSYTSFIKNIFELGGAEVVIDPSLSYLAPAAYHIKINDKLAFVDFSDFSDSHRYTLKGTNFKKHERFYKPETMEYPVFKRVHRINEEYYPNQYPMGAYYVSNNKSIENLQALLSVGNVYNPLKSNLVLHTNRVYAGAVITRKKAFAAIDQSKLLPEVKFDSRRMSLFEHFNRHKELISSLNISGAYYSSQDIGAVEAMFMGVCPISNDFDINLPFGKRFIKGTHYVHIADDYSDINEKLNFLYENRAECKDMGDAAYELVTTTCSPKAITKWMAQVIEEYYE